MASVQRMRTPPRSPSTLTPHCSALHQRRLSFFLHQFSVPLCDSPISGPPESACSYLAGVASLQEISADRLPDLTEGPLWCMQLGSPCPHAPSPVSCLCQRSSLTCPVVLDSDPLKHDSSWLVSNALFVFCWKKVLLWFQWQIVLPSAAEFLKHRKHLWCECNNMEQPHL